MGNLLEAWREFLPGKRRRKDVAGFSIRLMENILALHADLAEGAYRHGGYSAFKINDPKPRDIHKAGVRDRLVHHAVHRILYPLFDRTFAFDSYSCRRGKGVHKALDRFRSFARAVSRNHMRTAWVLKGDIRKFFANIDHSILVELVRRRISDESVIRLLREIIGSFHTPGKPGVGLPLGNLTSQLLVNVYLDAFDQFVKRELKITHYIRYADDFVILHEDRAFLECLLPRLAAFLRGRLRLELHPGKVSIATAASGVDFLGWIHFPHHRVLRPATKRRLFRRANRGVSPAAVASFRGFLKHGDAFGLLEELQQRPHHP